jgi:hypothetical protein
VTRDEKTTPHGRTCPAEWQLGDIVLRCEKRRDHRGDHKGRFVEGDSVIRATWYRKPDPSTPGCF